MQNLPKVRSRHQKVLLAQGWLSTAPSDFKREVTSKIRYQSVEKGEAIFRSGDASRGLVAIVSGAALGSVTTFDQGAIPAHLMFPGSWIGATTVISGTQHEFGLVAANTSVYAAISLSDVNSILADRPEFWRDLAILTVANQRILLEAAKGLMYRSPRRRLIATLCRLVGAAEYEWSSLDLPISHTELAVMSNLSRSFVADILADLEDAGIVERNYGFLSVLDKAGLHQALSQPVQP
ncbi:MAG: Crp/Fnr family transcriptional regulator [Marinosulfonomonas sp.]